MKFSRSLPYTIAFLTLATARAATPSETLTIYFIDVEGGQSTLLVTPNHESFLIDTGWPGNGQPDANPGDPTKARDANRIVAAARDAGIKQIDYLMLTHFHADHDGGVVELSQLMPIRHFVDHGGLTAEGQKDPGMTEPFDRYVAVRNKGLHIEPKPGDRLPLTGVDAVVVSSDASTITSPLPGAGEANKLCAPSAQPPRDLDENPRSTGVRVTFGKFSFLDVGDLSGQPLFNLACPKSLIGPVDVYLVAHHGGPDVADPATFSAFKPRVAIMNNGVKKGGAQTTYQALHHVAGLEDVWQLHKSDAAGDSNFPAERVANLDESTAFWIKLTAAKDGSFHVVNARTHEEQAYGAHVAPR